MNRDFEDFHSLEVIIKFNLKFIIVQVLKIMQIYKQV